MTLQRTGFGDDGSSTEDIGTSTGGGGCPPGTVYFAYYQPTGSTTVYRLVQQPLGVPEFQIPSQPASAGHGRYWFAAADPVTLVEFDQSPAVIDDARNTTQNTQSASSPASRNLRYAHRDHLGSTRLLTDERGIEIGRWKYFPFGMEAESAGSGAQRMKFTGHERDGEVGLDYMLARYSASALGRGLNTDPASRGIKLAAPGTWNRYPYVRNNPLKYIDPTGEILTVAGSDSAEDEFKKVLNGGLLGMEVGVADDGTVTLEYTGEQGPATEEQAALEGVLSQVIDDAKTTSLTLSEGSATLGGSYAKGDIDMNDAQAIGNGPGATAAGQVAHEIAEQFAKQVGRQQSGTETSGAHQRGIQAENGTTGYTRGPQGRSRGTHNRDGTVVSGSLTIPYSRGGKTIYVTFQVERNNITDVTRSSKR